MELVVAIIRILLLLFGRERIEARFSHGSSDGIRTFRSNKSLIHIS